MTGFTRVEPVNTKKVRGEVYEDHYDFGKVFIEEITDGTSVPDGVDLVRFGEIALWKYKGKQPVILTEDGAHVRSDKMNRESRNQAYFALSILADKGYVSGWKKL